MKNYLLTDFNSERWDGIDLDLVERQVKKLNEKLSNKIGRLFGEIGHPIYFDVSLSKASHSISNLSFSGGKIYGDVEFLSNDNGRKADDLINNKNYRFGLRGSGLESSNNITAIFTWDIIE